MAEPLNWTEISGRFDAVDVKVTAIDGASSNFSRTMSVVLKGTQ
jgi:hypothetical protein